MFKARCTTKCPQKELKFRSDNGLLHALETREPFAKIHPVKRVPDPSRICKSYCRSAAAKKIDPNDVRTLDACLETINYLESLEKEFPADHQWSLVYEYINDRLRAIRQDIIVQNKHKDPKAGEIYEKIIKFYLRSGYRCERLTTSTYVRVHHQRELTETLERWFEAQHSSQETTIIYILHSIQRPDIVNIVHGQKKILDEKYETMMMLISAYVTGNFVRFFRIVNGLEEYYKYALSSAISEMRVLALTALHSASQSPIAKWPLKLISKWLLLSNDGSAREMISQLLLDCNFDEGLVKFQGSKKKDQLDSNGFLWISISDVEKSQSDK
ncbi:unnamed protein product [Bursaphelenchus xylophilus]|uniref:(pine wood nematode) hypothetical protein n=1 Tax=Bursaphelenchus xylophilus TaxID=6326 RepID=A0A1I7S9H1_BURXY|nr:unnamed protein product [Bursaphelenchus xylophilus]CAG9111110.1 unnamed protein product [Bursaphelenchus xylophilus]